MFLEISVDKKIYVIMPNHIHGIIEIKKSMDVLDRECGYT